MREVSAYEAKTHLAELLDAVERGETIILTRRGKPIAKLEPCRPARLSLDAIDCGFAELRRAVKPVSGGLRSLIGDGRRF